MSISLPLEKKQKNLRYKMLGNKLRSWMDAVRPRKKQQRKEKQLKANLTNPNGMVVPNSQSAHGARSPENEILEDVNRTSIHTIASHAPRYSGANLSSPESAYSTGYSTDGTSPGAPPEYYINIRTGTRYFPSADSENEKYQSPRSNHPIIYSNGISSVNNASLTRSHHLSSREDNHVSTATIHLNGDHTAVSMTQDYDNNYKNASSRTSVTPLNSIHPSNGVPPRLTEVVANSGLTSPRQRNRIRTNPWVPGSNLSPGNSCVGLFTKPAVINSPVPNRYLSPTVPRSPINRASTRRDSLSSSSCSSLSAASINWDPSLVRRSPRINSGSDDEEDCTLNEMMGKYDESYVYEKETDILSDSDPTDCETDIDTGQDGGDEDDPVEHEFDFIDTGSYLEFNADNKDARNTGHCTYYNYESQRRVSRRRTTRRSQKQEMQNKVTISKQISERRRRPSSSKRKHKITTSMNKSYSHIINCPQIDGSRSAGATPLSVRRTKHPLSKLVIDEHLRRRSNSVNFCAETTNAIDQRDKEADKKYKELIVEAEHILMSMKTNGLSPRRLPGPPNKRVELLRNAESAKPDAFIKNRLIEDTANLHLSRIPSSNFNSPRFSPKKNHITNFINNNTPVLMRRDMETHGSPITPRKELHSCLKTSPNSPLARNKYIKAESMSRRSPKYRKKFNRTSSVKQSNAEIFSSESDDEPKRIRNSEFSEFSCPQSEPVKRKVYSNQCKTVAFNLNYKNICSTGELETSSSSLSLKKICLPEVPVNDLSTCRKHENANSTENLRQQVLLNTIASLKRSLEDQSASLRQVYRSSQNINMRSRMIWKTQMLILLLSSHLDELELSCNYDYILQFS